jgi:DNA (cytosine-5)-methyltransferase 1
VESRSGAGHALRRLTPCNFQLERGSVDQPDARFRFIDLFAGLGGFHVALGGLGGKGVFAAEWEPTLNTLYEHNFGIAPWSDVNELDSDAVIAQTVPDHDVLTAGFPCQPFSKAGEQLGFEHTLQGRLFFKVFDILSVKRPRRFILENVPNILRHRGGRTAATIVARLEELGYEVQVHRLSPHQFGIPQVRERAYFVGSLDGLDAFEWPTEFEGTTSIASVLRPDAEPSRNIHEQTLRAIDMWGDFLRRSPAEVKLPSFPIWSMEFRATYPYETTTPPKSWVRSRPRELDGFTGSFGFPLERLSSQEQRELIPSHSRRDGDTEFPVWKQTFIRQNREFFLTNRKWIEPWLDKWQPWEFPSSFQKFEWNAQGGVRDIEEYVLQVRASGIRVKRPTTAPSLIAMTITQVPILGASISPTGKRRYMTPDECAELQSLGGIDLPEGDIKAYKALGNAVNASVVRAIAEPLLVDLKAAKKSAARPQAA